jgi:dipeptidyl aminopeptidase/acylaminoacyl peptidase
MNRTLLQVAQLSSMIVIGSLVCPGLARAQGEHTPGFEERMSLETQAGPIAASPDGERVLYSTRRFNWERNRFDWRVWIAGSDEPPRVLVEADQPWLTRWSPDGRVIAVVLSDSLGAQIHIVNPSGGAPRRLTSIQGGVEDFQWSPDGSAIALLRSVPTEGAQETVPWSTAEPVDRRDRLSPRHLWILDLPEGVSGPATNVRRLTRGDYRVGWFRWSPDGARIAFDHRPVDPEAWWEQDVSVVEVASGEASSLVETPGPDYNPEWSPDGRWIVFVTKGGVVGSYRTKSWELAVIASEGGATRILTGALDVDPTVTLWGSYWIPQGIFFSASRGLTQPLFRLDASTGAIDEVGAFDGRIDFFDISGDGQTLYFVADRGSALREVYRTPVESFEPSRVSSLTAQVEEWALAETGGVRWRSPDGVAIEGVLATPPDLPPQARRPLLVVLHGGPRSTVRPTLVHSPVVERWVAEGGVVLWPNFRGSLGYGEEFRKLLVGDQGRGPAMDVLAGIDHLVAQGIADPGRVAVMGWSYGGYLTAYLVTRTHRFHAAVLGAADSDLRLSYAASDNQESYLEYLGGTPWEQEQAYTRASPITAVSSATTPTLIFHGTRDQRVPPANARLLYRGLKDSGVETELILYDGGHAPSPREDLVLTWYAWQWFARHIWEREIELPWETGRPPPWSR